MDSRHVEQSSRVARPAGRWRRAFGMGLACLAGVSQIQADAPLRAALAHLARSGEITVADHSRFQMRLLRLETERDLTATPAETAAPVQGLEALRRDVLLSHPGLRRTPLLFVVRQQYQRDHHNTATFFPSARHEYNNGHFTPGGALKTINLASGETRTLLETTTGLIRDPEMSFDGRTVLFSLRRDAEDSYHLYEIESDGSGLRQLTLAREVDDLDPVYLPDGDILFSSTREPKYCMCNRHIMANLHRMDGDGANVHQIGKSTLFEGHAALMPDGRILYDRWEYVDRNFGDAQALWSVNPDGTGHAVYWGNNTASPGGVIDGRVLPGGDQALCIFGSCHDRPWGALALVDRRLGLDGADPVVQLWPTDARKHIQQDGWEKFDAFMQVPLKYEDPFPLDDHFFLCSRMTGKGEQMGLFLVDTFGNEILLHAEEPGCFDPMPLAPRERPPVIPDRRDFETAPGVFLVQNVYAGTHMAGVEPGSVKRLRVIESPEKRFWTEPTWGGQGIEGPAMNWHDFNNKRILGTVPVEPDGSAYFAVPSDRFVYFQLLDENGMMVQSMRSGTLVQSGETASCVGCHEDRRSAPVHSLMPEALRRAPSELAGWHGPAREFNFLAEVQPVFDRHCVECHDYGKEAGKVFNLAPDRDLVFNTAYNELWRKGYLKVPGAGPASTQEARAWGSHASKLGQVLLTRYRDKLSPEEFDRVVTWIDLNAPYYPSYASAYPRNLAGRSPLTDAQLARLEELTGTPLRKQASHNGNRGPQVSFDRPELSPCLTTIKDANSLERREALEIIRAGAIQLAARPDADMPGFVPSEIDQWRDEKYAARRDRDARARAALRDGTRHYEQADLPLSR